MPWHGGQPTGWIPEQDAADVRQWRGRRPEATPRQSLPLAATLSGVCGLQTGGAGGDVSLGLILAYRGMIPLLSVIPRWLCRFQGPAWAELYMEVEHFSMLLANSPRIFIMFGHSLFMLLFVRPFLAPRTRESSSGFKCALLDDLVFLVMHMMGHDLTTDDGIIFGGRYLRPPTPAPLPLRLCEQMGAGPSALTAAAFVMLRSAALHSAWAAADWAAAARLGLFVVATRAMLLALSGPALPPPALCSLAAALGPDPNDAPEGSRLACKERRVFCRCLLLLLASALHAHCVVVLACGFWLTLWSALWAAIRPARWALRLALAAVRLADSGLSRGLSWSPVRWAAAAAALQARAAAGAAAGRPISGTGPGEQVRLWYPPTRPTNPPTRGVFPRLFAADAAALGAVSADSRAGQGGRRGARA